MGVEAQMTLCQLQEQIKESIESRNNAKYWIRAEISEIKNNFAGHCYLDLVDRPTGGDSVTAKAQAIIWANSYRLIRPYFETTAGQPLAKGMHILICVQVQYSALYGLSLIVMDIDPAFTVGEQEMERQKTIIRLKNEGMFEMNSTLELPLLPKRVAIISSDQAAGYRDFINHLHMNEYGFKFRTELFNAPMQGNIAPEGIIEAMDKVAGRSHEFDILLILRGGGSAQDLACFDDYNLAANIAQFPLPVITGIGHDHDYHIADMVAHTSVKTPTALADFIVDIFVKEDQQIIFLSRRLSVSLHTRLINESNNLKSVTNRLVNSYKSSVQMNYHKLQLLEQRIRSNNPLMLLTKGYALVLKEGRKISHVSQVQEGDEIRLIMDGGTLNCTINNKDDESKR
ncbi:MAG: exodeoxyribonuclease VII large subunit [Bacteroidales bacterium]|jgi:exodeoxyribonuclease VII large subunit